MTRFHFNFISSAFGQHNFRVYDRTTNSERRLHMDSATKAVSFLCRDHVPAEILEAFNAWRAENYASDYAYILSRYGKAEADEMGPFVESVAAMAFDNA
jgi:hypothetical protein